MAQTQVKPSSGGSWNNVTGNGKSVTGISNLAPASAQQTIEAANLFTFTGGTAGARTTIANKLVAAVGRSLQWA